jgi:hypothetical protein
MQRGLSDTGQGYFLARLGQILKKGRKSPKAHSLLQGLSLSSLSLPQDVRIALSSAIWKYSLKTFFGSVSGSYGRWYFSVRAKRPSRGILPFRLAKDEILDRITAPVKQEEMGFSTLLAQEEVLRNIRLAQAYRLMAIRKRMENA